MIVNIASIAGRVLPTASGAYAVSKAGVLTLTRQMALEWGARGVRANSASPGYMRTGMTSAVFSVEEAERDRAFHTPPGRIAEVSEVARWRFSSPAAAPRSSTEDLCCRAGLDMADFAALIVGATNLGELMHYRFAPVLSEAVPTLPTRDLLDLPATRAAMRAGNAAVPVDTTRLLVEEFQVPGAVGDPAVTIRVVRPANESAVAMPALLHIHGGGFVIGDMNNSHGRICNLVRALGLVAVSVGYRLSPEHLYPAALHDVLAALSWLGSHAESLRVDADRIAIHGFSAGAGLAAAAALFIRDNGGPKLCFQYLAMPELDDRLETTSMREFTDTPGWSRSKAEISWSAYLGDVPRGSADVEAYAAPARAADCAGLPPAYISVMEFDPLRDEGLAYGQALLAAGVNVELHLFPGTFHGSSNVLGAPVTQRELAEEAAVLAAALRIE